MHGLAHRVNGPALFERAMGEPFAALHPALRRFHRLRDRRLLLGEVTTRAPTSPLAALLSRALGSPRVATHGPIRFGSSSTSTPRSRPGPATSPAAR